MSKFTPFPDPPLGFTQRPGGLTAAEVDETFRTMAGDVHQLSEHVDERVGVAGDLTLAAQQAAQDAEEARDDADAAVGVAVQARDDAAGHAQAASGAADDAEQSAYTATLAAGAAETAATDAEEYRNDAELLVVQAQTAREGAEEARDDADAATGVAVQARDDASGHAQVASDAAAQTAQDLAAVEAKRGAVQTLVNSVAGLNLPSRTVWADAAFAGSTDGRTFGDAAVATTAALAIASDGGKTKLVLGFDAEGEPLGVEDTGHALDALAAEGVIVITAYGGYDAAGAAEVEALRHYLGWLAGQNMLDDAVLEAGGLTVTLDALPVDVYEDEADRPPRGWALWDEVTGKPVILPVLLDSDGGYGPNPNTNPHGLVQIDPDDVERHVWVVHKSQAGNAVLDLTGAAWDRITGKPSTFPPSVHAHWQRIFYSDFIAVNRSGKTTTTSGYECTSTGATASGGTSGHLANIGALAQRFQARVSVGNTTSMFAGFYACSTSASQTNGARFHIIRQAGGWVFTGVQYVGGTGGSPSPLNTTLTGTPSDGSTWDIVLETDGTGTVAVTVTPLGGPPQSFTVTVPAGTVGNFGGQLNAGGGGYVLSLAGYIKTS
ncbi:MAG: hypothetical protein IAE99_08200 [Rhodothermales bacterium]|nr:hypothetical protein [Rhodothermales bacterium]